MIAVAVETSWCGCAWVGGSGTARARWLTGRRGGGQTEEGDVEIKCHVSCYEPGPRMYGAVRAVPYRPAAPATWNAQAVKYVQANQRGYAQAARVLEYPRRRAYKPARRTSGTVVSPPAALLSSLKTSCCAGSNSALPTHAPTQPRMDPPVCWRKTVGKPLRSRSGRRGPWSS
jgi:hypothetical protein